jgi:hypothetical protein
VVGISNRKIVGLISTECSKNNLDIIGTVTVTQGHKLYFSQLHNSSYMQYVMNTMKNISIKILSGLLKLSENANFFQINYSE